MNAWDASEPASGAVPVAVVMIALNEAHNMEAVLTGLHAWAQEVYLVDSYSTDGTIDIALRHGVHVVQRAFRGFGDQWNFALRELPIRSPWTMKLDPDERLTEELKREIAAAVLCANEEAFVCPIRLKFMGCLLPVRLKLTRLWRTGTAHFSDVDANEHVKISGAVGELSADILHEDSPDLHHWLEKQNRYTSAEAIARSRGAALAEEGRLFGTPLQRRMWMKAHFMKVPFRYVALFLYHYVVLGAWRAGWVGYAWSRLRADVYRMWEYKLREIRITGRLPLKRPSGPGQPDPRVPQFD